MKLLGQLAMMPDMAVIQNSAAQAEQNRDKTETGPRGRLLQSFGGKPWEPNPAQLGHTRIICWGVAEDLGCRKTRLRVGVARG